MKAFLRRHIPKLTYYLHARFSGSSQSLTVTLYRKPFTKRFLITINGGFPVSALTELSTVLGLSWEHQLHPARAGFRPFHQFTVPPPGLHDRHLAHRWLKRWHLPEEPLSEGGDDIPF